MTLLEAIAEGTLADVKRALAAGADVNRADPETKWTSLHQGIVAQRSDVVRLLLAAGANVNPKVPGYTPLHLAASYGDVALLKTLLSAGAELDARQKNSLGGETALVVAIEARKPKAALALIKAGADVTTRDNFGRTVLHAAARWGVTELIPSFAKKLGADVADKNGATPLTFAASAGQLRAVDALLKAKATAHVCSTGRGSDRGGAAIHHAAAAGEDDVVRRLIKAGVNVDAPARGGETALFFAIEQQALETIKRLLALKASVNVASANGTTPLMAAVKSGDADVVRLLLKHGADVSVTVKTTTSVTDVDDDMKTVKPGASLADMAKLMRRPDLAKLVTNRSESKTR